jgi:hypothetical protein
MEPISAFISIIGLLRMFKQEAGERKAKDHREFVAWLDAHQHNVLSDLVTRNVGLCTQMDELLREDRANVIARLDKLQEIIAALLGRIDGMGNITKAFMTEVLSGQCTSLLRQFVESGDTVMVYSDFGSQGYSLQFAESEQPIQVTEDRFLKCDLQNLNELGLLTAERNDSCLNYGITREAVRYVELLPKESIESMDALG